MKEILKNIFYFLFIIGIVWVIVYFLIMPIVEGGEKLDINMKERVEELDVQTGHNSSQGLTDVGR